mmetsp:Transcript_23691/g.74540  ORF Transcript_23691/g.74540 Transcript_23691/m.74540 type:complete len:831 (-) Transcript_23691:739-3231(-)|eukprot:CAMPEP_0118851608 /NCGR_PEP_ID=MMETSP1163-20130328/992_1 /TAXON_ID=124430 /ORGANISM="Phaeomonas parva, Strain CCMP2877" /LENGTH=830 /DNA_ID=CAMNT_0006783981 /DNA_START=41 /DNA_END=2533 /DNA_ORIENTATION=-
MSEEAGGGVDVPEGFKLVEEGSARMVYPSENEVFYNPVQVYNRDLSIAVIQTYAQLRLKEEHVKAAAKAKRKGSDPKSSKEAATAVADDIDWYERAKETSGEKGLLVLDALAASGLRSIRYVKEIAGVKEVTVNDLSESAVDLAKKNVKLNQCDESAIKVQQGDAIDLMYMARAEGATKYDVIDLDPYGTAAPFIDAAVQAVASGGLLCVTCTDMRSLTGAEPGSCYQRYGGLPSRGKYMHEMALRLVLQALDDSAARYRRTVEPLLSVTPDFYLRVFVRVWDAPQKAINAPLRRAYVLQSGLCPSYWIQPVAKRTKAGSDKYNAAFLVNMAPPEKPEAESAATAEGDTAAASSAAGQASGQPDTSDMSATQLARLSDTATCPFSGGKIRVAGPIYSDSMHNFEFIEELTKTLDRVKAAQLFDMVPGPLTEDNPNPNPKPHGAKLTQIDRIKAALEVVKEDLPDVPLHYSLVELCSVLHCGGLPMAVMQAALEHLNYRFGSVPRDGQFFKTDAPPHIIWDIMRKWVELHPLAEKRMADMAKKKDAAWHILNQKSTVDIDLAMLDVNSAQQARKNRKARYLANPEANWGPKAAASVKRSGKRNRAGEGADGGGEDNPMDATVGAASMAGDAKSEGGDAPFKRKKRSGRPVRQMCRAFTASREAEGGPGPQACTRFAKKAGLCTPHLGAMVLGPIRRLRRNQTVELEFDEKVNISKEDLHFYLGEPFQVKRREVGMAPLPKEIQEMNDIALSQQTAEPPDPSAVVEVVLAGQIAGPTSAIQANTAAAEAALAPTPASAAEEAKAAGEVKEAENGVADPAEVSNPPAGDGFTV